MLVKMINQYDAAIHDDGISAGGYSSGVRLAIIIPAYKGTYLEETLTSLAEQTNSNFRTYVGDDCSYDDLATVCQHFTKSLDIVYHRFPNNLGATSLVEQWCRSIELSHEPWVWLLGDDDVVENNCVECFYQILGESQENYNVYRFNTLTIDGEGRLLTINRPHPEVESALEFVYHRLRGNRESYACEYIFSREVYDHFGGMVRYPLAWCADDATWARFSAINGLRTISGPRVLWRRSGLNISSVKGQTIPEKLAAAALFLDDLAEMFDEDDFLAVRIPRSFFEMAQKDWFYNQFQALAPIPLRLWMNWPIIPKAFANERKTAIFARLAYMHFTKLFQAVVRWIKHAIDRS